MPFSTLPRALARPLSFSFGMILQEIFTKLLCEYNLQNAYCEIPNPTKELHHYVCQKVHYFRISLAFPTG